MSTATIGPAPTMRAAWITESPTPPQPMTATPAPGSTPAVRVTPPQPVSTAQPISAARSSGTSLRIGTATDSGTTACSANEETALKWRKSVPSSESREVPSASVPVEAMRAPVLAEVRPAGTAALALAARGHEREHDVVAGPHALDAGPDLGHDARRLVADHERQRLGQVAVDDVQVAVTDAAGRDPHEHLSGLRRRQLDVEDLDGATRLPQHGGLHPHPGEPTAPRRALVFHRHKPISPHVFWKERRSRCARKHKGCDALPASPPP